ncbi:MAG: cation diffusion facilitator family transporter [Tannerellaceae bacterium]|jgi:cobalt-zinc-cadmium efflux system protein|nr:cation diffusion facilitator family transporter [Tannerellaceae bacterium]
MTQTKKYIIGITLNSIFVMAEWTAGKYFNSAGLISDAGHNLSDVVGLILALVGFRLSIGGRYKRMGVTISCLNAVILLVAVGFIIWESIEKIMEPVEVNGSGVMWTAGIGVLINGVTAWLFVKEKEKDINARGAYYHMAADTLVSVGVLVSGLVIRYTGMYIIDPVIGLAVSAVIIYGTVGLLKDSLQAYH